MLNTYDEPCTPPNRVRCNGFMVIIKIMIPFLIGRWMGCNRSCDVAPNPPPHPLDLRYATPLELDSHLFWRKCDEEGLIAVKRHVAQKGHKMDMTEFQLILRSALQSIGRSDPALETDQMYLRRVFAAVGGDIDAYYNDLVTTFAFWHEGRNDPFPGGARHELMTLVEDGMSLEAFRTYVEVGATHNSLHKRLSLSTNAVDAYVQIRDSQTLKSERKGLVEHWSVKAEKKWMELKREIDRRLRGE